MATWQETLFLFGQTASVPTAQTFTYDPNIVKNFPGVEFSGTEANAIYTEAREVSGDFWIVQNAQFNGTNWIPQNLALPVYAEHYKANGQQERLWCAAGTNPVVWTTLTYTDPFGALVLTPAAFTTNTEVALSLAPTWNAGAAAVMTGVKLNVTDTSSSAASKLIDLQVGATSKFSVDKNGNVFCASLGTPRVGTQTAVPSDGSAQKTVSYAAFPTATNFVIATIKNNYPTIPRTLTLQLWNYTTTGFDIYVAGGNASETVEVNYLAFGT